jgi:AcrR family transcriptional regulator
VASKAKNPPTPRNVSGHHPGEVGGGGEPDARQRILYAAYDLFCRHGIHATGIDRIVAEARVAKMTLYKHFASKEALALAVLDLREELWTQWWLEDEVRRRAKTPVTRLLAIFDVFDDWFRREDYEGCLFTNTLLESPAGTPIFAGGVQKRANVRSFVRDLADDAGASDPEDLARKWQQLMTGAIVAATEGDADAAPRAHALAELLLTREGLVPQG